MTAQQQVDARSPIITFYRSLQVLVRGGALSLSSLRVLIDTQISRRALVLASGFVLSCKNASSSSSKGAFIFAVYAPHGCKDVIINKLSANKLARATQHHHQRGTTDTISSSYMERSCWAESVPPKSKVRVCIYIVAPPPPASLFPLF
jgi:hypothetical protein